MTRHPHVAGEALAGSYPAEVKPLPYREPMTRIYANFLVLLR
jgi:hypothetical protein